MCGEALEELTLPKHLEKVGAYAFYNCFHLKNLSCCSTVRDWGAGVFTGCTQINKLDIRIFPEEKSSFKEILSELRQMLVVDYRDKEGKLLAKLIFPEFFEESIENTPARIIMREMHGCGHMYRYCFNGTDFQFWEYDKLLPTAEILESPALVCRMALYRLYWPKGLTEEWKEEYWKYIKKYLTHLANLLHKDPSTGIGSPPAPVEGYILFIFLQMSTDHHIPALSVSSHPALHCNHSWM